jgi:hypothetical protein
MQQPPALTPQQDAIRQVRERYERGDLSFDRFEYALNALLQAQTPEECQAIVQELPSSPLSALDVLPSQQAALPVPTTPRRTRWWVAFMGGVQRLSRPWKLAEQTIGIAVMGGIEVDLSLAALPQQGVIRLFTLMGGAKLFVPRTVDVSVRSFVMLGGVNALGESNGGFISFNHEESQAQREPGATTPQLEIQFFGLMGGAEVIQVDGPVITGAGLMSGTDPQMLPGPYDRNTLRSIRQAEREARRQLRRQQRHARDW